MNTIPFIDWNRNGQLDPVDIAVSLTIAGEEKEELEDDKNDIQRPRK